MYRFRPNIKHCLISRRILIVHVYSFAPLIIRATTVQILQSVSNFTNELAKSISLLSLPLPCCIVELLDVFVLTYRTTQKPLIGTAIVKEMVDECCQSVELRRPDLLHSQMFRKYLATVCQVGSNHLSKYLAPFGMLYE